VIVELGSDLLSDGVKPTDEELARCPELAEAVADRAYEAEARARVLIADGLDTVNELRESSRLHDALRMFAEDGDGGDSEDLASALERHRSRAVEEHGEDAGVLPEEVAALFARAVCASR
jgi:hypothetical protein